jgi:hypothetical protein
MVQGHLTAGSTTQNILWALRKEIIQWDEEFCLLGYTTTVCWKPTVYLVLSTMDCTKFKPCALFPKMRSSYWAHPAQRKRGEGCCKSLSLDF